MGPQDINTIMDKLIRDREAMMAGPRMLESAKQSFALITPQPSAAEMWAAGLGQVVGQSPATTWINDVQERRDRMLELGKVLEHAQPYTPDFGFNGELWQQFQQYAPQIDIVRMSEQAQDRLTDGDRDLVRAMVDETLPSLREHPRGQARKEVGLAIGTRFYVLYAEDADDADGLIQAIEVALDAAGFAEQTAFDQP